MDALERYLTQATRGVYGKKRAEVHAELRGNLEAMATELQLAGLERTAALKHALQEFGDPRRLAQQFTEVHTMPAVHKLGIFGGALAALVIAAASSAAPLEISSTAPLPDCATVNSDAVTNAAFNCAFGETWLQIGALRQELTRNGGGLEVSAGRLSLRFAGDASAVNLDLDNPAPFVVNPGGFPEITYHQFNSFTRGDASFVSLHLVVRGIAAQSKLPVRLEGWRNPVLRVGDTRLALGTTQAPFEARALYDIGFSRALRAALPVGEEVADYSSAPGKTASFVFELHRISLPDGVYALLSADAKGKWLYTIAPSVNGVLEAFVPSKRIEFAREFSAVGASNAPLEGRVVVMRLSGALNRETFTVVQPAAASSLAVPR
jgi:hypothetical protein